MPARLREAHMKNDSAVLEAYGLPKDISEDEIVDYMFELYHKSMKAKGLE